MKKILFVMASFLLSMTACQNEEPISQSGVEIVTTLSVNVPQNKVQSRALGDEVGKGTAVNRCILEIYYGDLLYTDRKYATRTADGQFKFENLRLISNQSYDFVLWADNVRNAEDSLRIDNHYDTSDLGSIVRKGTYKGNDESYDAFFAQKRVDVGDSFSESITLTRPFGLLTFKTNDLNKLPAGSAKPDNYGVKFRGLMDTFSAKTGVASTAVMAEAVNLSYISGMLDPENGLISYDYLFANAEEATLSNISMDFYKGETLVSSNDNLLNIPIQRNYRTNVSGNLISAEGKINIVCKPEYTGTKLVIDVESISGLNDALKEGATNVQVTKPVTETATIEIPLAAPEPVKPDPEDPDKPVEPDPENPDQPVEPENPDPIIPDPTPGPGPGPAPQPDPEEPDQPDVDPTPIAPIKPQKPKEPAVALKFAEPITAPEIVIAPVETVTPDPEKPDQPQPEEKKTQNIELSTPAEVQTTATIKIELPKATVTVDKGNYKRIEATTGQNTFVVNEEVVIEEVFAKKGNIEIYGTVHKIEFDAAYPKEEGISVWVVTNEASYNVAHQWGAGKIKRLVWIVDDQEEFDLAISKTDVNEIVLGHRFKFTKTDYDNETISINHSVNVLCNAGTLNFTGDSHFEIAANTTFTLQNLTINTTNEAGKPVFHIAKGVENASLILNRCAVNHNKSGIKDKQNDSSDKSGLIVRADGGNNVKVELRNTIFNLNGEEGLQRGIVFPDGSNQTGCSIKLDNSIIASKVTDKDPNAYHSIGLGYCGTDGMKIDLINSQITGMYYPITVFQSPEVKNDVVNIKNTMISGYTCLNLRSGSNMTFNITNGSHLIGRNFYKYYDYDDSNNYAVIVLDYDANMNNNTFNVDNSTLEAWTQSSAKEYIVEISDNKFAPSATKTGISFNFTGTTKLLNTVQNSASAVDYLINYAPEFKPTVKIEDTVQILGKQGVKLMKE